MKARRPTARTIARLTIPILAIVAMASGARAAGPQGGVPGAGGQAGAGRQGAIDPLRFVVPEPPPATRADTTSDVARVDVSGRPLHVPHVRPQGPPIHPHQVCVSKDGQLLGRVAILARPCDAPRAANAITVCLVQSGAIVAQAAPDGDGVFRANVPPGVYSVIAVGSGGFAASSVQVVPPGDLDDPIPQTVAIREGRATREATSVHVVNLVAVPPAHFGALECLLQEHVHAPPRLVLPGSRSPNAVEQSDGSHVRPTAIHDPRGPNGVRLHADGRLIGRMRRLHLETGQPVPVSPLSVFLIHDGVATARTTADENGRFEVTGLEPGVYSVVAVGPDGFAAFDILALPPREIVLLAARDSGLRIEGDSRQPEDAPEMLDGSLVAVQDVQQVLFQEQPDVLPMGGPPAGFVRGPRARGGRGARGSAFGNNALAEALLGAGFGAAVGVGVAAALDDDHVASPFSP